MQAAPLIDVIYPAPSSEFTRIHAENTMMFPFAAFDFGSVDLEFVEVDGRVRPYKFPEENETYETIHVVNLAPGSHSLGIRAIKGPLAGWLGRAPLLGMCNASIEFIAEPGTHYKVRFSRKNELDSVELVNVSTDEVVREAPCLSPP